MQVFHDRIVEFGGSSRDTVCGYFRNVVLYVQYLFFFTGLCSTKSLFPLMVSADRWLAIVEQEEPEGGSGIRQTKSICILRVRYRQEYDTILYWFRENAMYRTVPYRYLNDSQL